MANLATRVGQEFKKIRTEDLANKASKTYTTEQLAGKSNLELSGLNNISAEAKLQLLGYTGSIGNRGTTGLANTTVGYTGSVGYAGSNGTIGPVGYKGSTGYKGSAGYKGSKGVSGDVEVSTNPLDTYIDNKSIYVSSTDVAYYKTTIGWIEIGKLYTGSSTGSSENSISAGYIHTVFLLSDGTVRSVGYNVYGQLGDGTTTNRSTPVVTQGISNCISISAGNIHTVFLLSDGTVRSIGYNYYGQLGDGTTTNRSTPVVTQGISN